MGMAASQARFLGLTARLNNLELQVQQVNEKRTVYTNSTLDIYNDIVQMMAPIASNYDLETEAGQAAYDNAMAAFNAQLGQYNAEQEYFQLIDKKLELELKNLDTQHQAVQTEIDAVKKVIDKNIDMTFKTFA